jgi:outer membrane biosynthesis protein TonB
MAKTKVRVLIPYAVPHLGAGAGDVQELDKGEADALIAAGFVEDAGSAKVGPFDKVAPGEAVFPEPARGKTQPAEAPSTEAVGHSEKDFEPLPVAKPSDVIEPEADPDAAVTDPVDEPKPTPKAVDEVAEAKKRTTSKRASSRKKK